MQGPAVHAVRGNGGALEEEWIVMEDPLIIIVLAFVLALSWRKSGFRFFWEE